jgi:hypothetical protein
MNLFKSSQGRDAPPRGADQSAVRTRGTRSSVNLPVLWFVITMLAGVSSASAQPYSIDWFTVDGGGGMNGSGGIYTLSGTIGQPDAGSRLSGGSYSLQGGFWPGLVVPSSTGAPTVFIQLASGNVVISWLPNTPGFVLEETGSLSLPAWSPSLGGNPVSVSPSGGAKFYRLREP